MHVGPALHPNVQTVFISVPSVGSSLSPNSRQELEHRLDMNNDKVEALEAKLKLLEVKHEQSVNESLAKELIAQLKQTIAEKDAAILDLRCQLRLNELSVASDLQGLVSPSSGDERPAHIFATPHNGQGNPVHLLEMQAIRNQNINRRLRKVVLQTRWGELPPSSNVVDDPSVPRNIRAFSSFDPLSDGSADDSGSEAGTPP
ncbi:hypothetical protein H310_01445 [Aphanomyces invadans]|uniref:Uncharacterized protein n=1 Tax=Aphanomyces invadans TaxID=157072 RepID=A0A024UST4_9STRA|nr:hypothetical protein H310_01445 [Aphanomyces invadans]ETW08967.1 hypothetical protein H310_01445 [Aphanomyces invadans]|eukprot:XP_008862772.1 hypothetical protein H310_01445 [Aphanomyces invadans]